IGRLNQTAVADGLTALAYGLAFCVAAVFVIRWQSTALGNFGLDRGPGRGSPHHAGGRGRR
ncbi:MAG TPA: hypothetical protein VGW74_16800, partial [Propionibacteriaceae bacterium]|nr:hypothetical protein [Propionibacteriaceae bacterium]